MTTEAHESTDARTDAAELLSKVVLPSGELAEGVAILRADLGEMGVDDLSEDVAKSMLYTIGEVMGATPAGQVFVLVCVAKLLIENGS